MILRQPTHPTARIRAEGTNDSCQIKCRAVSSEECPTFRRIIFGGIKKCLTLKIDASRGLETSVTRRHMVSSTDNWTSKRRAVRMAAVK